MVCAVFLLIGIVDNDKKVKNQPDEWNNNRFNHDHQDIETNEQLDRKWLKHLLLKELLLV